MTAAAPTPPSGPPRQKQRARDAVRPRFAALLTHHPPAGRVKLAVDPGLDLRTELEFEPLPPAAGDAPAGQPVCFGLLYSGNLPRGLAFGRVSTKRGRWGSKPPESLQLLQAVPEDVLSRQTLQQRGMLRSLAVAYADLAGSSPAAAAQPEPGTPSVVLLYLAVELALRGWIELAALREFATQRGEQLPPLAKGKTAAVVETGGLLLWRAYLLRQAERLEELLRQPRLRNPLRRELSQSQVAALLETRPAVARAVLEEFALRCQLSRSHAAYPVCYRLGGAVAPPEPGAEEAATVQSIRAALAAEPGLSRRELAARYPSHLNVLAWLYEAEAFVELPGWYTLTGERLRGFLKQLPAGPGLTVPSVRDLKDRLGVGRREAEALRAWYVEHSGLRVNPEAAQAARARHSRPAAPGSRRPRR